MSGAESGPSPLGLGQLVFGDIPQSSKLDRKRREESGESDSEDESDSETDDKTDETMPATTAEPNVASLTAALSQTSLSPDPAALPAPTPTQGPSYSPLYLSTVSEDLPENTYANHQARKIEVELKKQMDSDRGGSSLSSKDKEALWTLEAYERAQKVDEVFERFCARVAAEGEQCVRYDLAGVPLPYQSDKVYDTLFPEPSSNISLPSTKAAFAAPTASLQRRTFSATSIHDCDACGDPRVFECQLMPNLLNVLKRPTKSPDAFRPSRNSQTPEERKKELEALVKGVTGDGGSMEWGTCMVFSCKKDCCIVNGSEVTECWREEVVLVQWEE